MKEEKKDWAYIIMQTVMIITILVGTIWLILINSNNEKKCDKEEIVVTGLKSQSISGSICETNKGDIRCNNNVNVGDSWMRCIQVQHD